MAKVQPDLFIQMVKIATRQQQLQHITKADSSEFSTYIVVHIFWKIFYSKHTGKQQKTSQKNIKKETKLKLIKWTFYKTKLYKLNQKEHNKIMTTTKKNICNCSTFILFISNKKWYVKKINLKSNVMK